MSLKLPSAPGASLFKGGYQSYQADEGAIIRNISACREISNIVRTSIGPCGRNKIIVNHLQKVFLTSETATILRELQVIHPAAKLLVMASQQQQSEIGDATNLVIILAGELLSQAETLLNMGLATPDIIAGYELAHKYIAEELLSPKSHLVAGVVKDFSSFDALYNAIRPVIAAKQYGYEDLIAKLVTQAVLDVMPTQNPRLFNVDNIRVVKIMGAGIDSSSVVKGMVFGRSPEGQITKLPNSKSGVHKVGVYTCAIDISQTETKGTVLLHNANEMLGFSKNEEDQLEKLINSIKDSGVRVLVAGSSIGELAMHYLNRAGILVIKVPSKFDIRRLCRVIGATPLNKLVPPMPNEAGTVQVVETIEIGGDRVTIFRQKEAVTRTSTIILRGATKSFLDDVERAIDNGVNVVKTLTQNSGLLIAGAGAAEIEIASRTIEYGERTAGILQHGIKAYGRAFEIIPRTLAENAGLDATEVLSKLYSSHSSHRHSSKKSHRHNEQQNNESSESKTIEESSSFENNKKVNSRSSEDIKEEKSSNNEKESENKDEKIGKESESTSEVSSITTNTGSTNTSLKSHKSRYGSYHHKKESKVNIGIDIDNADESGLINSVEAGILDSIDGKASAIKLATDAVTTILSVDQIVMAKRAGGPKMPAPGVQGNWDMDD